MELGGNNGIGGNSSSFHGFRSLSTPVMHSPEISQGLPSPQLLTQNNECIVREQDRFMPIANVIRIMRKILPPHAKISDDAKETIQECVSEYISFITSEANDRCQREQRKTITAEDVLWAMSKLGFDDYIEPLTLYLHRYRELDGGDRGSSMVKRMVEHSGGMGFPVFHNTTPFHGGSHHGFFTAAPAMNLFKDDGAGPEGSCVDGFPPRKQ